MARPRSTFSSTTDDDRFGNAVQRPRVVRPVGHARFLSVRKPPKAPANEAQTEGLAGGTRSVLGLGAPGTGRPSGMPAVASPVAVAKMLATRNRASGKPHPSLADSSLIGRPRVPLAMKGERPPVAPPAPTVPTPGTNAALPAVKLAALEGTGPTAGYAIGSGGAQKQATVSLVRALRGIRGRRLE